MSDSTATIEAWLYATLHGDATLSTAVGGRVVGTLNTTFPQVPFVVFQMASSRDIRAVGGDLIDTSNLYHVKAISTGSSWTDLEVLAERIETLLGGKTVSISGSVSLTCVREMILKYPEVVAGQEYRHWGGTYRIRCN